MNIKLYWLRGCGPCEFLKKEMKKLPATFKQPELIEHADISAHDRQHVGIKAYPTMAFFSDDGRILKTVRGSASVDKIQQFYNEASRLENIQRKSNVKSNDE